MKEIIEDNFQKIVCSKIPEEWVFVFDYLQFLRSCRTVMNDEGFNKRLNELFSYISDKISTPYDGDVLKSYLVIEQKATEEEYNDWLEKNKSNE